MPQSMLQPFGTLLSKLHDYRPTSLSLQYGWKEVKCVKSIEFLTHLMLSYIYFVLLIIGGHDDYSGSRFGCSEWQLLLTKADVQNIFIICKSIECQGNYWPILGPLKQGKTPHLC